MARFRPVNASPRDKGRQTTRLRSKRAPSPDDIGPDPWILPIGSRRDNARSPTVKPSLPVEATIQREVEEDDVAVPIPIGAAAPVPQGQPLGKIVTADGKEQPFYHEIPGFVYQPIPGFEHCFKAPSPGPASQPQDAQAPGRTVPSQSQAANRRQPTHRVASRRSTALRRKSAAPKPPARGNLKRSRSHATPDFVECDDHAVVHVGTDSESDEGEDDKVVRVKLEPSSTFYIGDFEEVKKCLSCLFRDLSLRTVRTIVTGWIKHREPKRRALYGRYHKTLPTQMPSECSPPWWPKDVQVNEPSHLSRDHVLKLAVDFLLVHREIDQIKRKSPWVQTLRKLAMCTVELVPTDSFSSSKNPAYDKEMRERATKHILPCLFDLAQSYEDHVIQYSLFEELNPTDPGTGREHTWQPMPRPIRHSTWSKQAHKREIVEVVKEADDVEALSDETEVDDALTNAFLSRKRVKAQKEVDSKEVTDAAVTFSPKVISTSKPTPAALSEPTQSCSSTTTSFDEPVHYLGFGDAMDLDIKGGSLTPHNNQTLLHGMYPISQPMSYSSSHPGFDHQSFLSQDNIPSFSQSFGALPAPNLGDSFQIFNTSFQPLMYQSALRSLIPSNNTSLPHQYEHMFHLAPITDASTQSFHGLPMGPHHNEQTRHAQ